MPQGSKNRPKKALVVLNPVAGNRDQTLSNLVVHKLSSLGWEICIRETSGIGDAEIIASKISGGNFAFDLIIVSGGDGTINEVVNGLVGGGRLDIPIGVIPAGTVNLLASELGLKNSVPSIVDALLGETKRSISLGEVIGRDGERVFLMTAGVGFDANAISRVSMSIKKLHGKTAYALAGLMEYLLGSFPKYKVILGGKKYTVGSVLLANGKYYAGRMVWAPKADIGGTGVQIGLFRTLGRLTLPIYVLGMMFGFLSKLKGFQVIDADGIIIEGPRGQPVQIDGDLLARLPVLIRVARDKVNIYAAHSRE